MTEEQAQEKMCCGPQVIAMVIALASPKPMDLVDKPGRCIGSACMAWRWVPGRVMDGYCGLAGQP